MYLDVVASLAMIVLATLTVWWANRREAADRLRNTRERRQMHIREEHSRRLE